MMNTGDDEIRRHRADLAAARTREENSRAARNNALERGYMRPDLAGPSIDRFYKNKGIDALRERFDEETGPSLFGVKRGNPFTQEGRAARADANEARRDLPDLWDLHAKDRKNRDAVERAFADRYGRQHEQDDSRLWPEPDVQDRQGMAVSLEGLARQAKGLEDTIVHMESEIGRALRGLVTGNDVERALEAIAERRKIQLERMFELGGARAQMDELENRIHEHDERAQARQADEERDNAVPAREDHLDWLKPVLDAPLAEADIREERHPRHEDEERGEDYLDWWKR